MGTSMLEKLADWKAFERMSADLLAAEGFVIESEPGLDTTGTDFVAVETYRAHDPQRSISVRWRVQCKHYARSAKNLGREEIEAAVFAYETRRRPDEGLFLIVSSDYTEPGKGAVDAYIESRRDARVTMWNGRQIVSKLTRHPELLLRYGLTSEAPLWADAFDRLRPFAPARVLFVSDQSAFAHDLASAYRKQGLDVVFLPVWNYDLPDRLSLFLEAYSGAAFRLVVLFLGDTFGTPLPTALQGWIIEQHRRGAAVLLFPFLAWLLNRQAAPYLADICPVQLIPVDSVEDKEERLDRLAGQYRKGDFRWLANFDSFAEDQYVEYASADDLGLESPPTGYRRFALSHSFELLKARKGAKIIVADASGNPLVVVSEASGARVAYVNSCCHACLSTVPVSSPLSTSREFATIVGGVCEWLLGPRTSDGEPGGEGA